MQRGRAEIGELARVLAEGAARLARLRFGGHALAGARALDPAQQAPGLAARVDVAGPAVAGRDQREHAPGRVGFRSARETRRDVTGDAQHVLEHVLGPPEDVAVDLLEQVAAHAALRLEAHEPGVVDQPGRVRLESHEPALGREAGERRARVVVRRGGQAQRSAG